METSLYLVSNVIRIYAISIFLDSFFGNLKCKRIIKIIAYISYYFIGSLVWIISQNTNINLVINTAAIILISILYRATWKKRDFSAIHVDTALKVCYVLGLDFEDLFGSCGKYY